MESFKMKQWLLALFKNSKCQWKIQRCLFHLVSGLQFIFFLEKSGKLFTTTTTTTETAIVATTEGVIK